MIEPAEHDFKIYVNNHTAYEFTFYDDEAETVPTSFSGYSFECVARKSHSATVSINLNPTFLSNVVTLNLTPAQAAAVAIPPNAKSVKYEYDLVGINGDDEREVYVRGIVEFVAGITT